MESIPGETARAAELRHAAPRKRVDKLSVVLMILLATLCVASGETLLSAGMKAVGKESPAGFGFVLAMLCNWHVLAGVGLMTVYFGLYSLSLSMADISFVLPFTGLSYLFVAIFARYFLHEPVSPTRWIGAGIILIGVIVVGRGG